MASYAHAMKIKNTKEDTAPRKIDCPECPQVFLNYQRYRCSSGNLVFHFLSFPPLDLWVETNLKE